MDCPLNSLPLAEESYSSFAHEHLARFNSGLTNYYWTEEFSETGKFHVHIIIFIEDKTVVQPLRCYLGTTYKHAIKTKAPVYWKETYGDSKKIQVYSLQLVKKPEKLWAYIHKDCVSTAGKKGWEGAAWDQESWDNYVVNQKDIKKETEDKLQKDMDDFWTTYKSNNISHMEHGNNLETLRANWFAALQAFHTNYGDIAGFRQYFLKSSFRNNIIDFNTFMMKLYRL